MAAVVGPSSSSLPSSAASCLHTGNPANGSRKLHVLFPCSHHHLHPLHSPKVSTSTLQFNKNHSLALLQQQQQHATLEEEDEEEGILAYEEQMVNSNPEMLYSSFYQPLLQQCIRQESIVGTRTVHAHIIKTGWLSHLYTSNVLINVYSKCGLIHDARKLFENSPHRDVGTWTVLMTGYSYNSQPDQTLLVFIQLLQSGKYPFTYTMVAVVSACLPLNAPDLGRQLHAYAIKYALSSDEVVANAFISFYSKCRQFKSALEIFRNIPNKSVFCWTTIISACSDNGHAELGLRIFVDMLLEDGKPNDFTLTSAMSLCCTTQSLELGKQIHSMVIKLGCESSLPVRNSVMYLYMICGQIDDAQRLTFDAETINIRIWNTMIAGHAKMMDRADDAISAYHRGVEALEIFLKLNRSSMKPDTYSYSNILTICSGLAALGQGQQVHAQIIKEGYLSDVVISSALVNMYAKCGSIEKASKAFVEMSTRTLISWTTMIAAYSQHGRSEEAILLFEDMRLAGVRPNQVAFVAVLAACSHAGLVDKAHYYFRMMRDEYQIKPVMDHYACMVDMFVRQGQLDEALDFIETMDFKPNEVLWNIVLAGSRIHGKMDLAFYAADRLLELKPRCPETYVVLLNLYLSAERWHDVSRVRKIMKEDKIGNVKDRSWISIKDKIYYFKENDETISQYAEIQDLLGSLLEKAKGMGYITKKSFEKFQEEDGRTSISYHSEKQAIAFGFLNTSDGTTIRVHKSTTTCGHCHEAIKSLSILMGREIIVRDTKKLHRFKDGQCSCGDFASFI